MWDEEEINKKIKDAADQYHPAYDDNAWDKMELMLDEHLPQKKEKRRFLYFLPVILLLGGGIFYMVAHLNKIDSSKLSEKTIPTNASAPAEVTTSPSTDKAGRNVAPGQKLPGGAHSEINKNSTVSHTVGDGIKNDLTKQTTQTLPHVNQQNAGDQKDNGKVSVNSIAENNTTIENPAAENSKVNQQQQTLQENTASATTPGNNNTSDKPNADNIKAQKDTLNLKNTNTQRKQKRQNKSFAQNFGLSVGIGPDISGIRLSETGKPTLTYGGGISYSLSSKFTLHTGFYVARKIYSVGKGEYHVQPGIGNYNYLQSVNANCKVYEIPLTLSYNFGTVKNHNWFASAGLSSYFMKKEAYVYFYKYPSGYTDNTSWAIENQNKNYFSVLDISAGYMYTINRSFSISAEPYLKLPLSGIGAGKIKLNSGGILFTLTLKPFYKK